MATENMEGITATARNTAMATVTTPPANKNELKNKLVTQNLLLAGRHKPLINKVRPHFM